MHGAEHTGSTGRPKLSLAARESVLQALLDQHPQAWVAALADTGLITAMPPEVPLAGHHVVTGISSTLELVVPGDQYAVIETWQRMRAEGGANISVHPVNEPERSVGLHFIDLTHRFGVVLALLIGLAEDTDTQLSRPSGLVPRTAVIRKDQLSVITAVDEAATAILGWSADELVGRRTLDLIHPDDQERAIANFMDMLGRPGSSHRVKLRHRHKDGSWLWLEVTNHNRLADPDDPHVLADMVDIHEEVAALQALRDNEQLLRRLTEALPVGVLHIGVDRSVNYCNARLGAIVGVADAVTVDEQLACVVPADRGTLLDAVEAALRRGRDADVELSFQPPAGKLRRTVLSLRALTGQDNVGVGAIACLVDITYDVNLREELEQRVRFDALTTGLNHASILAELQHRLEEPGLDSWTVAYFIDLDNFKQTNDQYGHMAGDRLLKHVATRLRQAVGDDGLVGRLGGDEFLVVLRTPRRRDAVTLATGQIAAALDDPVLVGREWTRPSASIGVAYAPPAVGVSADSLVAAADEAMYEAKRGGDGAPRLATPDA